MSGAAIMMMLMSMLVIWGGLALAVVNLMRSRGEEPPQVGRDL